MKKLMIACAVAATTVGAFAGGCGDDDPVVVQDPVNQVYRLSFTGKTTDGVPGKDIVTPVFCGDDDVQDGCVVRVPANLKIEGWVVLCDITCGTILDVFNAPKSQAYWTTKPYKADIPDGAATFDLINVIGKKGKDAEAAGKFTGTVTYAADYTWSLGDGLVFAGLGKTAVKNGSWAYFPSFSGNFAGSPVASWYIKGKVCEQTHVWEPCTMAVNCDETPNTVAFGKWAMKYDAAATKKVATTNPSKPSYATIH